MKKNNKDTMCQILIRLEKSKYNTLIAEEAKRKMSGERKVSLASLIREAVEIASRTWKSGG